MLVAHVAAAERWTLAALFTVACLAALAAAPSIARRHAWHPVAIALYVYAAMNCLKTIIDGGMLTCQLLPSLLMLALLAAATDGNHLVALARRYFPAAVLALIACAGGWAMVSDEGWGGAATGFIPVLIPLALGLLCWAFRAQTRTGLRRLALAIGIGWLALGYLQEAVLGIGMLLRPLPPQARVVVIDPVALVARDASVAVLGATPLSIYRRFGDDPLKPSRVLIQTGVRAADIPGRELTFAVRFIDGGQRRHRGGDGPAGSARSPDRAEDAAHVQSSLYSLLGANRAPDRVNTAVFLFRTASPDIPPFFVAEADHLGRNNFQVHLHLIAATLRTQGLAEFVMMPLLRASDRGLFLPGR
jgi:hypothetical protein